MYPSRVKEFVKRIANENPIKTQMNLFFEAYKPVQQDGVETVDKLSQRLLNAALLEDRRAAVLGLKGLAKDFKLHVGTNAMSTLVSILKNDILDTEIVTASLETLVILCKCDNIADPSDLGVMFTEIYIKDPRNVHLLVDILEESDFYVRFYIIELLNNLLKNKSIQLQDCILTSPRIQN